VLENSILAPLYKRLQTGNHDSQTNDSAQEFIPQDSTACETGV
jgi:hypothetical protein